MVLDIVMPFYGDAALFRAAVRSVQQQESEHWRLTVIDDAYPDRTAAEWILQLGDPRMTLVRNETNKGVSGVFRQALDSAQGDLLTIMGCDDILLPGYVSDVLRQMGNHPDASYYQPGVRVIDALGVRAWPMVDRVKARLRPPSASEPLKGEGVARSLLIGNWTYFPSIAWRTSAIRLHSFDDRYDVVLDLQLQLEVIAAGGGLLLQDRTTFMYRRHSQSVSSLTARDGLRFLEERALFDEWAARFAVLGWSSAARAARVHLTSRLNALTLLLGARPPRELRRTLLAHAFGGPSR